ncbi:MAG: adenylate/guanylate cyclase domain-containing protein [Terriglobia bacterium]
MISSSDILHSKILIVDDQEINIILLEQMLRGAGYASITTTTDPSEVCALHLKNHFELILLDLQMPGVDGFQVMEGLKEIEMGGYLPVLVITAQPDHKLRALKNGAKDFISKPFDLAEVLIRVYNMVEVRLLHLETKRLLNRVVAEQQVSERLLLNVLPYSIAERLKERSTVTGDRRASRRTSAPWRGDGFTEVIADSFAGVTVLFADIVGFTKFSQGVSAEVLVSVLNDIFTRFDTIADNRGLEKVKTIGDAYMAAAGLPVPVADHTSRAAHMALDMMEAMDRFNAHNGYNLKVRIGINTGAVVAGVIGKRKFLYDLWGDVVNTASRMESHGVPGRIQVTDSARCGLGEPFQVEERGVIDVKSKGEMRTWFLNGRNCQA